MDQPSAMAQIPSPVFSTASVIGSGLMGTGIAAVFAAAKMKVTLIDTDEKRLGESKSRIQGIAAELLSAQLIEDSPDAVAARVDCASDLAACKESDLILEAIFENLDAKHALYTQLEQIVSPSTIIGSNTSGLLPSALCRPFRHPERFLVIHFWNPPHAIPLVEVVPNPATKPEVIESVLQFLRSVRCDPVLVAKEIPGFIGNRLQYAVLREALAIVRSGAATSGSGRHRDESFSGPALFGRWSDRNCRPRRARHFLYHRELPHAATSERRGRSSIDERESSSRKDRTAFRRRFLFLAGGASSGSGRPPEPRVAAAQEISNQ